MGVTTVNQEFTTPLPAPKMFNALVLDYHKLLPKAMPQVVKSIDLLQGQWGTPGSITSTKFPEGCVKYKIEGVDKDNLSCKYTLIEGDKVDGQKVEFVAHELKLVPSPGSGSVLKVTTHYHTKGGFQLSEAEINADKEKATLYYKLLADFLSANPNY